MTNLFKRFFTHKSKFLLIIISLLGLAFSYSCSCRDNPELKSDICIIEEIRYFPKYHCQYFFYTKHIINSPFSLYL